MKKTNKFLRIAINSPLYRFFDYLLPEDCDPKNLKPGIRVHVPFGRRNVVGILVETVNETDVPQNKLKRAIEVLDEEPLIDQDILGLLKWASCYYHYPFGEICAAALPKLLRSVKGQKGFAKLQDKIAKELGAMAFELEESLPGFTLNDYQKLAIDSIVQNLQDGATAQPFLLDGVTSSGKTEVYLQVISKVLKQGKQALVLIPEIGLTPQTVRRFQKRFNVPVAVFNSRLTDRERLYYWLLAAKGIAKIVIGTRSAIFTPLLNPGIIVVDEEHDLSFRQQSGFRYATRDLAIKRGEILNIPVIFGSATPSLISLYHSLEQRFEHLLLPERAGAAAHPAFRIIDLKGARLKGGFAVPLIETIDRHLKDGNQVLVFLNRRGYAPTVMCHTCGWMAECDHCDVRLTLHQNPSFLSCHHCGKESKVPQVCKECGSNNLLALGLGTERAEVMLNKFFPETHICRIDRDTTQKKGALEAMFAEVKSGECQILLGTQMLTKGHHFPNVTLVAILNADSGLFSADFQAVEYLSQLIIQVSGRCGRSEKPGEVCIQTHHPEHPLLQKLVQSGYSAFAKQAMLERQNALLPPFSSLVLLRAESRYKESGMRFLQQVRQKCIQSPISGITILGPIKATIARRGGLYRAQLWMQSTERDKLDNIIEELISFIGANSRLAYGVRWCFDVDPVEA